MSTTLRDFYAWLADHFEVDGQAADPDAIRAQLEQNGFGDVTAYDVREAVSLMYDEGDVFTNDQSSVLEAYTGGNNVDQSFNGSNIGNVNASGTANTATTGSSTAGAPAGGTTEVAQQEPVKSTGAPQPPPMDATGDYTDLDAAVEQIVYVTNITNNTTNNTTTINDNDVFEDNDVIVDNSVDQNILANGNVTQDFDNITQGDEGIANTGNIADSTLVTGGNEGVVADQVAGAAVVGDGNETTVLNDSDNNAIGDGSIANEGDGNAFGDGSTALNDSNGNAIGDGASSVNVGGDNSGVLSTGEGDVEAITGNAAGQTSFGDGDQTVVSIDDSNLNESAVQTGDGNVASITDDNDTFTNDVVENNTVSIEETTVVAGGNAQVADNDDIGVVNEDTEGEAFAEGV